MTMLAPLDLDSDDMANFVPPEYFSKREIEDAGKFLSNPIPWQGEMTPEVERAFRIAHTWRDSCAWPMHRVGHELRGKVQREGGSGVTAGRLKRLESIRRKLFRKNRTLYQLQDIAGVRAILPTMADVNRVSGYFENGDTSHNLTRSDDYISEPKPDGYRSKHLILKFVGSGEEAQFNRNNVEIQLRTRMQHAWATAVEAVGLVRRENLKNGEGSPEWLRFFALMSGEIALRENCPTSAHLPESRDERLKELLDLDRRLNALKELDSYNHAIKFADNLGGAGQRFFLISYDPDSKTVFVQPHSVFREGADEYNAGERLRGRRNLVLVEIDRARNLKAAYPNYFLDVTAFLAECRLSLVQASPGLRYTIDLSFLSSRWRRKRDPGSRG